MKQVIIVIMSLHILRNDEAWQLHDAVKVDIEACTIYLSDDIQTFVISSKEGLNHIKRLIFLNL